MWAGEVSQLNTPSTMEPLSTMPCLAHHGGLYPFKLWASISPSSLKSLLVKYLIISMRKVRNAHGPLVPQVSHSLLCLLFPASSFSVSFLFLFALTGESVSCTWGMKKWPVVVCYRWHGHGSLPLRLPQVTSRWVKVQEWEFRRNFNVFSGQTGDNIILLKLLCESLVP